MHELIQSEMQSDIISEKCLSLPAEVFRFRSVKYTPPKGSVVLASHCTIYACD